MNPDQDAGGGGLLRRLASLEATVKEQNAKIEDLRSTVYAAGYKIGGAIVVASLTFAVSVIRLLG
jgi:hypothetical protein